jgi:diguanylate cyclase (GGDEF)-like protein
MSQKTIVILNPLPSEAARLSGLAKNFGQVTAAPGPEGLSGRPEGGAAAVAVVDVAVSAAAPLRGLIGPSTALILTGPDERALRAAASAWPPHQYVDPFVLTASEPREEEFSRSLERALEDQRQRSEAAALRRAVGEQEAKVREVYEEIREIKGLINANFIREIEKRIAIEAKYVWFQRERERIEVILRKIYAADDVSSLLDIVPDLRDIVHAAGATMYIIEENDVLGRYLKPLVWDDAFLTHSDFSRYIAPLDSPDFAAAAARYGHAVNAEDLGSDPRLSPRYRELLKTEPKSLLAVPIMHDRKVIGVVEVYDKTASGSVGVQPFSREDQQILQSLSEHMAIAMTKLNLIQYDALTGLLRPDPFFEKVIQKVNALSQRRKEEGIVALVMGDVDWFKAYNDRNGHEEGNKLLRELAQVLKNSIREDDLLCRYGGEEFLFFLTGLKNDDAAAHLTERIRRNVEDHVFEYQEFQPERNLTMSFGITVFPGRRDDQPVRLTKADLKRLAGEADLALAEAKGKRRPELELLEGAQSARKKNRVSVYPRGLGTAPRGPASPPPREWTRREKRKHERHSLSAVLVYKRDGGYTVANTVNLSLGGARIVSTSRLPLAQTVDTILLLGERANVFRSDIIYSERGEAQEAVFYSGLKFRDQTPSDLKGLEDYLSRLRRPGSAGAGPASN